MKIVCNKCQAENLENAAFCGACGERIVYGKSGDTQDSNFHTMEISRESITQDDNTCYDDDDVVKEKSTADAIEEFCQVLRDVWDDGILEDDEAELLELKRAELDISYELFQILDLKIRDELGLISTEKVTQPVSLGINVCEPIILNEVLGIMFSVQNMRNENLRSVKVNVVNDDELFCFNILGMPKEITNLKPNATKATRFIVKATDFNSNGEVLELEVVTVTESGVRQVHKCDETITIPIYQDKEDRDKGIKKLILSSSSGGVANANLNPELLKNIRELYVTSDGGVSNIQALSKMLKNEKVQTGITLDGESYQPLTLFIDHDGTEELEVESITTPTLLNNGRVSTGTMTDEASFKISSGAIDSEILMSNRSLTSYGIPGGGADSFLFAFDPKGINHDRERMLRISRKQMCIKYENERFFIRDGGDGDHGSTNGTLLNGRVVSSSVWMPIEQHDKIDIARGILVLVVNMTRKGSRKNKGDGGSNNEDNIDKFSSLKLSNFKVKNVPYEYMIVPNKLDIGTAINCGLRLKGDNISELNARLLYNDRVFSIKNLDSLNNVFVNNNLIEVNQSVVLMDADIIKIGSETIKFSAKCFNF